MVRELVLLPSEDILISRLQNCRSGNSESAAFETICCDIIEHLFSGNFRQFHRQSGTSDAMFRMDLQCSHRRNSEFWQFIYDQFRSILVVFEFKNYAAPIDQNLIYITQKYLHPRLSRAVAFMVSRQGFSPHAQDAAKGILMESGKLIVDLTDDDLIAMLRLQKHGEDPSEYLMSKVEQLFMSISV